MSGFPFLRVFDVFTRFVFFVNSSFSLPSVVVHLVSSFPSVWSIQLYGSSWVYHAGWSARPAVVYPLVRRQSDAKTNSEVAFLCSVSEYDTPAWPDVRFAGCNLQSSRGCWKPAQSVVA